MPATLIPKGGAFLPFKLGSYTDQVGVNDVPANAPGRNFAAFPGLSTVYVLGSSHDITALNVYKKFDQTQVQRNGTDGGMNKSQTHAMFMADHDYNVPTQDPKGLIDRGVQVFHRYGYYAPHYGSGLGFVTYIEIVNSGSFANEFAMNHGYISCGTAAAPTNCSPWGVGDWGVYGPIGLQPDVLAGASTVVRNGYNGSPVRGASVGWALQNLLPSGPAGNKSNMPVSYPVDIGYLASGRATGGSNDAFKSAFQAGGQASTWSNDAAFAGDQGQNGVGFRNKARNDGVTPTSRLGAIALEGLGEAGGLVFGVDTNDANRVSLYRVSNGNLNLRGNLNITGAISAASGLGGGGSLPNSGPLTLLGNPTGVAAAPSDVSLGPMLGFAGTSLRSRVPLWVATGPGTVLTSSSVLTSILAGAPSQGSLIIPPNTSAVGSRLVFDLFGTYTYASGGPTLYVEIAIGGVIIGRGTTGALSSVVTGGAWSIDVVSGSGYHVQSIGSTGKIIGIERLTLNAPALTTLNLNSSGITAAAAAAATIDWTVAQTITVKMQWSGAASTYSIQLLGGGIFLDG